MERSSSSVPFIPGMRWSERKERDAFRALLQLRGQVERGLSGIGAQDAVIRGVTAAQILNNRFQNADIVIDCENDWLAHRLLKLLYRFHKLCPAGSGKEQLFLMETLRPVGLGGIAMCETGIPPPSEEANPCCTFSVVPSTGRLQHGRNGGCRGGESCVENTRDGRMSKLSRIYAALP